MTLSIVQGLTLIGAVSAQFIPARMYGDNVSLPPQHNTKETRVLKVEQLIILAPEQPLHWAWATSLNRIRLQSKAKIVPAERRSTDGEKRELLMIESPNM